mgnify:CR=1 FL=1
MSRRLLALERISWSEKKKAKVAEVMVDETMLSKESSLETDNNGTTKVVGYLVKQLPWESERLRRYKNDLDENYRSSLTERAKDRLLPRNVAFQESKRPAQCSLSDWTQRSVNLHNGDVAETSG